MIFVRCIKTAIPLLAIVTCIGCNAKQDKPDTKSGAPQEKTAATAAAPQSATTGSPAVPSQDLTDARSAAAHVLAQFEAGDFPAIYREAAPGFKKLGTESQFAGKFQLTRQRVGVLENPKEISAVTRPDKSIVLVYRMENERFNTDMRLTFARAQNKKMELAGLNQHDEPKK